MKKEDFKEKFRKAGFPSEWINQDEIKEELKSKITGKEEK